MATDVATGSQQGLTRHAVRVAAAWLLLTAACAVLIGSIGGPHSMVQGAAALAWWMITSGWPVALYFVSSLGLGAVVMRAVERRAIEAERMPLVLGVGLSVQLAVGHAINCVGAWLPGVAWNFAALVPCVVGCVAAIGFVRKADWGVFVSDERSYSVLALAGLATALAGAVLIVAACNPPGLLWGSEFGGFDALSYHLQLPQEWLGAGRLAPVTHNVYSYLPSYLESAFVTLGLWGFVPRGSADGVAGLLAGEGAMALSCQLLHAGFGLASAWMIAGATRGACGRVWGAEVGGCNGGLVAGVFAAGVPWVVVTGSLAYNEMGVNALFAAALIAALDERLSPWAKGVLAGWLVGVACGVKPTALFFAAPPVGLVLLANGGREHGKGVVIAVAGAVIGGAVALAPWMLRNYAACGNPVFPYLHGVFGGAHWTPEQFARFASVHHFDGSWMDRLRLLVLADPDDPAGLRHRGLMHSQWSVFPFAVLGAMVVCAVAGWRRGVVWALVGAVVLQIAAWLAVTHLQSRFLLPLVVPGGVLIGMAAGWLARGSWARARTATALVLLVGLYQSLRTLDHFWSGRDGRPNLELTVGPEGLVQREVRGEAADGSVVEGFARGEIVYLFGDSTPFYVPGPVLYHTTWDTLRPKEAVSADAMEELERELRRRGVSGIIVNPMEITRLSGTGWYDPAVTPATARAWAERSMRTVRVLESGQVLMRWKNAEAAR
jgi:hypothetical protein